MMLLIGISKRHIGSWHSNITQVIGPKLGLNPTQFSDKNQGDAAAEAKFKEISAAFEVLSDPKKKETYDR